MTLSPNTSTCMAPRARSTRRVRISRIAFDLALMSMAQMPRITGGLIGSLTLTKSEWEAIEDRDDDRVRMELERADEARPEELNRADILEGRSFPCMLCIDISGGTMGEGKQEWTLAKTVGRWRKLNVDGRNPASPLSVRHTERCQPCPSPIYKRQLSCFRAAQNAANGRLLSVQQCDYYIICFERGSTWFDWPTHTKATLLECDVIMQRCQSIIRVTQSMVVMVTVQQRPSPYQLSGMPAPAGKCMVHPPCTRDYLPFGVSGHDCQCFEPLPRE